MTKKVIKRFVITDPVYVTADDFECNEGDNIGYSNDEELGTVYVHKLIHTAYGDGGCYYKNDIVQVDNAMLCIAFREAGFDDTWSKIGARFSTLEQALKAFATIYIRIAQQCPCYNFEEVYGKLKDHNEVTTQKIL